MVDFNHLILLSAIIVNYAVPESAEENPSGLPIPPYREMIYDFLWPRLDTIDLDNVNFQQDGATCHTSNETIDFLREKFSDRFISRIGNHN